MTTAVFKDNQNNYVVAPIQFTFVNDKIEIKLMKLDSTGSSWDTLENISYIEIMPQEFTTLMNNL